MSTKAKVIATLKTVYDEGEVNAMQVWYGQSDDGYGWCFRRFGDHETTCMGRSWIDVMAFVDDVQNSREAIDAMTPEFVDVA
jgi:hypothetical protein